MNGLGWNLFNYNLYVRLSQEHSRGPRRPGTTLQLFDVDEDEREEPAVHCNTEQQPIEAPTQVEQPAVPTVAAEKPLPRRYPARIRRPPDRLDRWPPLSTKGVVL